MTATFLDRYMKGEHEQVWEELYKAGNAIYQARLFGDALAVTQETMRRVRKNIDLLISRLTSLGFGFGTYPDGHTKINGYTRPYHPPRKNIDKEISRFERLSGIGKLPLSLKVFWQIVGEVNLIGYYPDWPAYSDPLVIFPIEAAISEYEDWRYCLKEGIKDAGLFQIPLAPDYYHKDNISGGAPYTVLVPNWAIDGTLENESHLTTFVNYLRICFRQGGFPGIHGVNSNVEKLISQLSDGLLPF
jgi:hypothetical protein